MRGRETRAGEKRIDDRGTKEDWSTDRCFQYRLVKTHKRAPTRGYPQGGDNYGGGGALPPPMAVQCDCCPNSKYDTFPRAHISPSTHSPEHTFASHKFNAPFSAAILFKELR